MERTPPPKEVNPLIESAVTVLCAVFTHPSVVAALRAATVQPEQSSGLLTRKQLARELHISAAQVSRLCDDGMPRQAVGKQDRFVLAECREWLNARGSKAAPKRAKRLHRDDSGIDVSDVAGLKRVGGSR